MLGKALVATDLSPASDRVVEYTAMDTPTGIRILLWHDGNTFDDACRRRDHFQLLGIIDLNDNRNRTVVGHGCSWANTSNNYRGWDLDVLYVPLESAPGISAGYQF